jgi:hypothetical protein
MMRMAVKMTAPDADTLRSAAVAVVPATYASEVDFIANLVVLSYSLVLRDRDEARQRMLQAVVPDGASVFKAS